MHKKLIFFALTISLLSVFQIFGEPKMRYLQNTINSCRIFNFKVEGLPINVPLIFLSELVNGKIGEERKIIIDADHRVIDLKSEKELWMMHGKFARGEPIKYKLCAVEDKRVLTSVTIVPHPIEASDEAGHVLSLELRSPDGDIFWMEATGFEPLEKVELCFKSEWEAGKNTIQASEEGKVEAVILPAVIGKRSGAASLEIKGKNTKNLNVHYRWGPEIFDGKKIWE